MFSVVIDLFLFLNQFLMLILVGFLVVRFVMSRGGVKSPSPCIKLVRIILEIWDLVPKYTHKFSFRKYNF